MSSAADLSAICQRCGLCCDGTLFPAARLTAEEVAPMRKVGLAILESGGGVGFELPCPQLERASCSCSIYEERPRTCRRFECALLARARTGETPVEAAVDAVARTKELIATLQAKGMDMSPGAPRVVSGSGEEAFEVFGLVSELMERLANDFARAKEDE
jgi:Fe-S-cluster containining protein